MEFGTLLSFGYIHDAEKQCSLYRTIPDGVAHLICDHYFAMYMYECEFVENPPYKKDATYQLFKTIQAGQYGVGKTSLLTRFAEDTFSENAFPTIGIEFKIRTIRFAHQIIKLQIWDEPQGKERFRRHIISKAYYRGAHGIFLVFDVANDESFEFLRKMLSDMVDNETLNQNTVKLLIGNKCDLTEKRKVTMQRARQFAEAWNMEYVECSAKSGINVQHSFLMMVERMLSFRESQRTKEQNQVTRPEPASKCHIL